MSPSSRGLGHRPFTAVTGVRIPLGTPNTKPSMRKHRGFFICSVAKEVRAPGFDKIVRNDFEQPQAGPEGVRRRDAPNNSLGDATIQGLTSVCPLLFCILCDPRLLSSLISSSIRPFSVALTSTTKRLQARYDAGKICVMLKLPSYRPSSYCSSRVSLTANSPKSVIRRPTLNGPLRPWIVRMLFFTY